MRIILTLMLLCISATAFSADWRELQERANRARAAGDLDGYFRWSEASGAAAAAEAGSSTLLGQYSESAKRDAGVKSTSSGSSRRYVPYVPPKELTPEELRQERERKKQASAKLYQEKRENKDGKYSVAESHPLMRGTMYKILNPLGFDATDQQKYRMRDYEASKTPDELMHWFMLTVKDTGSTKGFIQQIKDKPDSYLTLEIKDLYAEVNGNREKLREYFSASDARRVEVAMEKKQE